MAEKRTYNLAEAAAALEVSREKLKKMVRAGEVPGIKSDDLWLFSRASIETFLETGRWPSPAGADRLEVEELAKIRMLLERMDGVIVALGILDDVDSAETLPRGRRRIA